VFESTQPDPHVVSFDRDVAGPGGDGLQLTEHVCGFVRHVRSSAGWGKLDAHAQLLTSMFSISFPVQLVAA
jgi:hypothetical protein